MATSRARAATNPTSRSTASISTMRKATDIRSPVLRLNAEAIQEFRVNTVNANANEGRSSGAQINLVSKTGTNNWHGALFEWYRGTLGKANDWFNNRDGVPVPPLVHNLFGGSLGGPIMKDKAFFFYSYEGQREARSDSCDPSCSARQSGSRHHQVLVLRGPELHHYGNRLVKPGSEPAGVFRGRHQPGRPGRSGPGRAKVSGE